MTLLDAIRRSNFGSEKSKLVAIERQRQWGWSPEKKAREKLRNLLDRQIIG